MRGNDERQEELLSYLRWKEDSGNTTLADYTQHGGATLWELDLHFASTVCAAGAAVDSPGAVSAGALLLMIRDRQLPKTGTELHSARDRSNHQKRVFARTHRLRQRSAEMDGALA